MATENFRLRPCEYSWGDFSLILVLWFFCEESIPVKK